MSVNIPNGSSWYFYSQLFRGLLDSQQSVPSLAEGDLGELGGGGMLNFVLLLTSAFHQNHFFYFFGGRLVRLLPCTTRKPATFSQCAVILLQRAAIVPVLSTTSETHHITFICSMCSTVCWFYCVDVVVHTLHINRTTQAHSEDSGSVFIICINMLLILLVVSCWV